MVAAVHIGLPFQAQRMEIAVSRERVRFAVMTP